MGAKQTRDEHGLTDLERRFATHYLDGFNGTKAYTAAVRDAGRKVTQKTAEVASYKMLRRPAVREFIKQQRDKLMNKAELSVGETLEKLRQLLMYDIRNLFDEDGRPIPVTKLGPDMAAAIVGIKVVTKGNADMGYGEVTEFKLADKVSVLDKALKYHGLFEKDNAQRIDPLTEVLNHIYQNGGRLEPKA